MIEKRAFHRVPFIAKAVLSNNGQSLITGRLENISYGGVLIRLDRGSGPITDVNYTLLLDIAKYSMVLNVNVEVAYTSCSQVGLKFSRIDQETRDDIAMLISQIENIQYSQNSKQQIVHGVKDDINLTPP